MNTTHLTDNELISHTIKFSNDPEKLRLATIMERMSGSIWDDLVHAGMNETYCTFTTEWGAERGVGQYISHLREEIDIRDDELHQLRKELEEMKTRTIMDFVQEVKQEIRTAQYEVQVARESLEEERVARRRAERELEMWDVLTHGK